jgi:hypothetical protein
MGFCGLKKEGTRETYPFYGLVRGDTEATGTVLLFSFEREKEVDCCHSSYAGDQIQKGMQFCFWLKINRALNGAQAYVHMLCFMEKQSNR